MPGGGADGGGRRPAVRVRLGVRWQGGAGPGDRNPARGGGGGHAAGAERSGDGDRHLLRRAGDRAVRRAHPRGVRDPLLRARRRRAARLHPLREAGRPHRDGHARGVEPPARGQGTPRAPARAGRGGRGVPLVRRDGARQGDGRGRHRCLRRLAEPGHAELLPQLRGRVTPLRPDGDCRRARLDRAAGGGVSQHARPAQQAAVAHRRRGEALAPGSRRAARAPCGERGAVPGSVVV